MDRRTLLKTGVAAGGLAAFAAGYAETGRRIIEGIGEQLSPRKKGIHGKSLPPEFRVDAATGAVAADPGQQISYAMCMGCTTFCGVRVRVERESGKVLRISGNPFHPLSTDPPLPPDTSIKDSFLAISRAEEKGLAGRSTACGRGAAMLGWMTSPHRVTTPLKRVGPRGAGRWQPIPFEQLVREVVEGGDLFGEGPVEGLRALRSFAPIDPAAPELGPKVNQVGLLSSTNEGREGLARRFVQKAFGSINFIGHGSYCGGSYRSGSGAAMGDVKTMPHTKPDFANCEFVIFCGTAPANAGNPFKRQGFQLAKGRTEGKLDYVVIDPAIGNSDSLAARHRGRWVPIKPATDGAFAMAMARWILENERYDARFLSQPNPKVATAAGEAGWCNATHLVIAEAGHPREGFLLRASDLGQVIEGDRYSAKDPFVVADPTSGELVAHDAATGAAELLVDRAFKVGEAQLRLRSAFDLYRDSARRHTLEEYADTCGIPADTIAGIAHEFTSHGKKAAVNSHGGTMAGNGFYNAFSLMTLNTLIGNINVKGGAIASGGAFPPEGKGPRYDLASFPGEVTPKGTPLSRNIPYERSSEFKRKAATGKPYPAEAPWYPAAAQLSTEWLTSALNGYPYPLKALLVWNANPIYGIPGLKRAVESGLKDSRKLPLIVAIDPFINETGTFADYIVPDSLLFETWGFAAPWHGVPSRTSTARWPVVACKNAKTASGEAITMETFFLACAKAMALPGFGADALADSTGARLPLEKPADWYFRAAANVAFAGQRPAGEASDEDIALTGFAPHVAALQATLKPEEWRRAAHVFTRGGRFQPYAQAYDGERMATRFAPALNLYNEQVATARSAVTGKRFSGVPQWTPPAFADGTPMREIYGERDWPMTLISQKSVLISAYTIALDRLRGIHPENPVGIHAEDAAKLGIHSGDKIRVATPGGEVVGTALVRHGVMRGVLVVEHGFGHTEFGARGHRIGDKQQADSPALAAGINLNDLGLSDPKRKDISVWLDPIAGSAVRQGLPARIARA